MQIAVRHHSRWVLRVVRQDRFHLEPVKRVGNFGDIEKTFIAGLELWALFFKRKVQIVTF